MSATIDEMKSLIGRTFSRSYPSGMVVKRLVVGVEPLCESQPWGNAFYVKYHDERGTYRSCWCSTWHQWAEKAALVPEDDGNRGRLAEDELE